MIDWIGAFFLVSMFILLLRVFGLAEKSFQVFITSRRSIQVIKNSEMDDDDKEMALQQNAKRLFGLFFVLALGGATAFLIPTGILWLSEKPGWVDLDSILSTTLSPLFLILGVVIAILVFSRPKDNKTEATTDYTIMDKILHHLAFKTYPAQVAIADVEERLFKEQLSACKLERPVFITALPRAGTTLLLECCARLNEFACHRYRDMPFVLVPCLWERFSALFQQKGQLRERAHGDGMLIDFDSPETLEEVVWKTFWRKKYQKDRIIPWQIEHNEEFTDFFKNHMRKIIMLRSGEKSEGIRYVSKNNLNIARIQILRQLFPDAIILVPFRQPIQHAASLLEQHQNFLEIHESNSFTREYMRAIGHFEFGKNLRPVDFDGWLARRQSLNPESLDFWLEYWVAAYQYLLWEKNELMFLSYDDLCKNPETQLRQFAQRIGSQNGDLLLEYSHIRPPRKRKIDTDSIDSNLLQSADQLYSNLQQKAQNDID